MPDPVVPPKALSDYPDWPEDPEKVERQIIAERKLGDLKPGNAAAMLIAIDEYKTANAAAPAADALDPETTFPRPTPTQREARGRQHQAEDPQKLTRKTFNDDPLTAMAEVAVAEVKGELTPEEGQALKTQLRKELLQQFSERISGGGLIIDGDVEDEEPRHVKKPSIFDQSPRGRTSLGDSLRGGARRGLEIARGAKPQPTRTEPRDVTPSGESTTDRVWTWLKKH